MRALAAVATLLLIAACAHAPSRPTEVEAALVPGQLLTADLQPFSEAQLLVRSASVRYLLVGEQHDDRCDHRVQAEVVRLLGGKGRWAVGLEMVDVDRAEVLDRFSAGELPLASLAEALDWEARWGIDFDAYEPIFAAAEATGTPVAPLNVPPQVLRALASGAADPIPELLRPLIVPEDQVIEPPTEQRSFLRGAYEGHSHRPPSDEAWRRFLYVQALWDSQMAWRAVQLSRDLDRGLILIAGAGHVQHGWGIAHRLRAYDPKAEILSLVAWRGGPLPDPTQSDLFFYCPRRGRDGAAPEG